MRMEELEISDFSVDLGGIPFPASYAEVKQGASIADINRLLDDRLLSIKDVLRVIPARTFERRKSKGENLRIEEVDGILRLLRVRQHALRVFEQADLADEWLHTANPALADERPIDMSLSDIGAREVEGVLTRIEHGIHG